MLGLSPSILSTSGLLVPPKNCLAYALKLSTYLLCPSAYIVSKAKLLLPLPETPVITISLFLGKVISILPDIEDEGSTINYIRSVSTLGNRELKKVLSRLVPVDLVNMEEEEQTEDVKDNIEISINLGDRYYSICQALEGKRFYLYFEEFTFVGCPADIERIKAHNIFSTKDEVLGIIELIYKNNIDSSKVIDIAKEISKII